MKKTVIHPFDPIYDKDSKILILGSIASEKSRELGYPYAHPQNRFWKVMEALFNEKIINHKDFLLKHNIALWEVIKSCDIYKSSDNSITNVIPNDIRIILNQCDIKAIFTDGKKATLLYKKYIYPLINIPSFYLPSTSPAYASKSLESLVEDYDVIKKYLK